MRQVFISTCGRQSNFRCPRISRAFSLVEVILALGIATFGILVIVALLPVGIQSTKDSLEETGAVNVLSEVIADRQATPFSQPSQIYQLPALTNTLVEPASNSFGIVGSSQFSTQLNQAQYRVDYIVISPESGRLDPYEAWVKVSWPAPSANPAGFVEGVATFPQP